MGYLKYVKQAWRNGDNPEMLRARLLQWRTEDSSMRVEHPTRIDRARSLGYRAKPGFVIIRQRVSGGGRKRIKVAGGRRPHASRRYKVIDMNYQHVAELRAAKKHVNCEVLNSYFVAKDAHFYWYEVILVDRDHPQVLADKDLKWVASPANRGRVYRGITAASRRSRGLLNKGMGAEKVRPSEDAMYRRKVGKGNI
jgi:large subunit ribosomal protein L15e